MTTGRATGDGNRIALRAMADLRRHESYQHFFSPVTARYVPVILERLPADARLVLDAGSGSGDLAAAVADSGRWCIAVDRSPLMASACRRRGIPAVVSDAAALPVRALGLDAAVASFLLPHVSDMVTMLAEFARVLRPGGVMIQVTWAAPEASPFTGLASDLLARFSSGPVRDRLQAARQRTDPERLTAAARTAGFTRIDRELLQFRTKVDSPGAWWRGMIGASTGLADLLQLTGPRERRAVEEHFLAAAGAYASGTGRGLSVPVAAHLIRGLAGNAASEAVPETAN